VSAEQEIIELVVRERRARDLADWETMRACFHDDSVVDISWTRACGPEFVELSRRALAAGTRSVHLLGPVSARAVGDRAIAEVGAQIAVQGEIAGTLCAISALARLVERVERRDGEWRIVELAAVYELDMMAPVIPGEPVAVERERILRYRPSYRMLSWWVAQTQGEDAVRDELPGTDRPELVLALYERYERWLAGAAD
jgi:hypothetical protein